MITNHDFFFLQCDLNRHRYQIENIDSRFFIAGRAGQIFTKFKNYFLFLFFCICIVVH